MSSRLRLATRESALALWQARFVAERLSALESGLKVELVPMTTRGDQLLNQPLAQIGGKGLFLKELEQALAAGQADLAVHSLKDVPNELPDGFCLAAILKRHDPRDAFVSRHYPSLEALPLGSQVGTSSLRRQAQLLKRRPDLHVSSLRGNVNTRLAKLAAGEFDAIILATAGLERLGLDDQITQRLDPADSLPAVGQGAIAVECRVDDLATQRIVQGLHHAPTHSCVSAERALSEALAGSCQLPLAGYAQLSHTQIALEGLVAAPDGSKLIRDQMSGPMEDPAGLGQALARRMLAAGADTILDGLREPTG